MKHTINKELPDFLKNRDVKNIVEMTSTESFLTWCEYEDDSIYKSENQGIGLNIGFVNNDQNMPIFISLNFSTFKGVQFLRYEATSRFVDYNVIDEWMNYHYPNVYRTNTMNLHNIKA